MYKYTWYIRGIYSFNRGHAEREQVTQQVAVFTGFPRDETRPGRCGGVSRHFHFYGETAGITTRDPATPCAVLTPPFNGHKAPVRNLRVETFTVSTAAASLRRIEIGRAATVKALDLLRLGVAARRRES